jgi:F-type H+-transporting ATPase subunit a
MTLLETILPAGLPMPTWLLAAASPDQHVYNHPFLKTDGGLWLWSGNMGNLILSGIILILGGLYVAKRIQTGPESEGNERYITKGRFANLIEVICLYIKREVVQPLLGDRTDKFLPFLLIIFFFILVNNLLGLIPLLDLQHVLSKDMKDSGTAFIGGTATQNIWVTATLAIVSAIVFNVAAVQRLGVGGYFSHMTGGAPLPISLILLVIEFAGQIIIKPVALAIRLFANMTAGHILMAVLFSFVGLAITQLPPLLAGTVTIASVGGAIAIYFLELFVAVLQAGVFMFLTTVFISLMDHHDDHAHEHEHGQGHGHEHAHA